MHNRLAALGLAMSAFVLVGCDPVQQAWIDNDSELDVVVSVDGASSVLVPADASGIAYSRLGASPDARLVEVFTSECTLLAATDTPANGAWLLRITVRPDRGVVFDHGASLSALSASGTVTETQDCQPI